MCAAEHSQQRVHKIILLTMFYCTHLKTTGSQYFLTSKFSVYKNFFPNLIFFTWKTKNFFMKKLVSAAHKLQAVVQNSTHVLFYVNRTHVLKHMFYNVRLAIFCDIKDTKRNFYCISCSQRDILFWSPEKNVKLRNVS